VDEIVKRGFPYARGIYL